MAASDAPYRIAWLDTARFLGMVLIFYGHVVERVHQADIPTAFAQYKLVYSFHVVLFFLISGYLAKQVDWPRTTRLTCLAASRLTRLSSSAW